MAHPLATEVQHSLTANQKYAGSQHVGVLPTGCIQCREGAKLVLFITGLCDKECFYCPVSRDKMYRDVVYANERAIHIGEWDGLLEEAEMIGAKGAGITGGDPMVVPDRVVELCRLMKAEFGPDFHLHLYTSCAFDTVWIERLKEAGLDEIRFHPEVREYADMPSSWHHEAIQEALRVGLTTLVEIPAIPGKEESILAMAHYLADSGAHGLNMNELEFSDPNVANLRRFGYLPRDDESQRVEGSRETSLAVVEAWKATGRAREFAVHFCSSPYKDAIQLMQRLRRRAERTARPFEFQTEEGTLVFGVLKPKNGQGPGELAERLRAEFEVPADQIVVAGDRVETAAEIAEVLADEALDALDAEIWLSEVYPTADRLEVERIPLPQPVASAQAATLRPAAALL